MPHLVSKTTKEPIYKLPSRFFVKPAVSTNTSVKHSLNKFKNATAKRGMTFKVVSSKTRPGSAGGGKALQTKRKTRRRIRRA